MQGSIVGQSEFDSIFGGPAPANAQSNQNEGSGFQGNDEGTTMFKRETEEEQQHQQQIVEDQNKDKTPEEIEAARILAEANEGENKDSLFEDKNKPGRKPKYDFSDIKGYFEERIKDKKLLPLEDGKLETPEDFDAIIEANYSYKLDQAKKELEQNWYQGKSPAWQVVAQFAEKATHPSELISFIQGVDTIDRVSELNAQEEVDAEKIVRMALLSRKEPQDIIDEQIATFKSNDKLISLAEKYQPILLKQEQQRLENLSQQKQQEEYNNLMMVKDIHENVVKVLETPFLGKHKMKKEEKATIYGMIASPNEETGGYRIFSEIDNLYESKDFETLRAIALLIADKKAYNNYIGLDMESNVAEGLLRKVKTTQTASSSTEIDGPENEGPKLNRQNYSNSNSGFGFFNK